MDYVLIIVRAIHLAATVSATGILLFLALVAEPAIRPSQTAVSPQDVGLLYRQLSQIFWFSLAAAVMSGVIWFFFVVAEISERSITSAVVDPVAWDVLTDTQFGNDWLARGCLALLLAASWLPHPHAPRPPYGSGLQSLVAISFLASLAWAGHASGALGLVGTIHLISDVLHLVAVGAWVGALLPLALLIRVSRSKTGDAWHAIAAAAVGRFSTLGIAAVGTILMTGLMNTLVLVGNVKALFDTDYGRLLVLKIVLFLAMIGFAAVNRLWLSPRLLDSDAKRKLERNSLAEALIGLMIIAIVGALGTLPPAVHSMAGHTPH